MGISGERFGNAASDYASYRAGFPDSIYPRLAAFDVGLAGQRLVDLGTGTGTLARGFAARGAHVIGVDPDQRMLAEARKLSESERLEITFMHGRAEGTGLPDASADVVTAGQCWHWFDQAAALREVQRLLGDSGRLVIAYFDWLPLPGNVVAATETLIEQYNPEWRMGGGCGMHPHYLADLSVAGLSRIETFSYDLDVAYSIEAWRGRIRASAGIVALADDEAERFDADLGGLLSEGFGEVLAVPHRVWVVVADH